MGEGDVAGEVTLGFCIGVESDEACGWLGVLWAMAGEPPAFMEPKLMFGLPVGPTAPPLGTYPEEPAALIVMDEGFLLWSVWAGGVPLTVVELLLLLLLTMVGPPTTGTAGWMGFFPFTGEMELLLPCCCDCARPPTLLDTTAGPVGGCFFVALAYER